MRFFIHPSAESEAAEILKSSLLVKRSKPAQPAYLCVRRYEGWMPGVLQNAGFTKWGSQAVLVKHTVHYSQRELPKAAVNLEKAGLPVSAPYSHYKLFELRNEKSEYDIIIRAEKFQRAPLFILLTLKFRLGSLQIMPGC